MPPYLPPSAYSRPAAPAAEGMGFMTLPVERTVGGFENNIWNPGAKPFPNGPADPGLNGLPFNPYTQGYMSGGEWRPYLPGKIVLGQRNSNSGQVGGATQWAGGGRFNVGADNYAAGASSAAPRQFAAGPGDARTELAPAMSGFHFGQAGQPGHRFMAGSMDGGRFYADQPGLNPAPDRGLGVLRPWNPALDALQKSRSQP